MRILESLQADLAVVRNYVDEITDFEPTADKPTHVEAITAELFRLAPHAIADCSVLSAAGDHDGAKSAVQSGLEALRLLDPNLFETGSRPVYFDLLNRLTADRESNEREARDCWVPIVRTQSYAVAKVLGLNISDIRETAEAAALAKVESTAIRAAMKAAVEAAQVKAKTNSAGRTIRQ